MQPLTLMAKISSMSCSVISASLRSGKTPAFAHSTSMPPCRSAASAATRSQSAEIATSPCANETSPPWPDSSRAAASPISAWRPVTTTLAPARAKTPAMPLPIPFVPPVTSTVRPAIGVNMQVSFQAYVDR
jgi:hypothetical protein